MSPQVNSLSSEGTRTPAYRAITKITFHSGSGHAFRIASVHSGRTNSMRFGFERIGALRCLNGLVVMSPRATASANACFTFLMTVLTLLVLLSDLDRNR